MLQQRDTTVLPAATCAGGALGTGETCISPAACFGDSGSPALTGHAGQHPWWEEVGVASRETTDGQDPNANPCLGPIIYTNTTYGPFRAWIHNTIRGGHAQPCTCRPTVRALDTATRTRIDQLKPKITR